MEIQTSRDIFDAMSFNMISYLQLFQEVTAIDYHVSDPISNHEVLLWERKNSPLKLPYDLLGFLEFFNGLSLIWKVDVSGKSYEIGFIAINKLENIVRVPFDGKVINAENRSLIPDQQNSAFFVLDNMTGRESGRVLLVIYTHKISERRLSHPTLTNSTDLSFSNSSTLESEIWYQDNLLNLHYICATFTHYMRLAIVHMGVIGWHRAYTPEGLSTVTRHWMGMFCKERLCIDLNKFGTDKC